MYTPCKSILTLIMFVYNRSKFIGNCIKNNSSTDGFEAYHITITGKIRGVVRITGNKFGFTVKNDREVEIKWYQVVL